MTNRIDLSCPAEIFRTELPTEETPAVVLTLFNLCDRVITSAEVLLCLQDAEGEETERLAFRGRALNGRPHSTFLMSVPCAPGNGVRKIEATVQKVWFADNEVWRRNPANSVEYTPNDLPASPALTRLKFSAGEPAVGYPSRQDGLWICVCGRPNEEGEPCCVRCGRDRDTVFARFSPEAVDAQISLRERQLDLNSRSMREDTNRLQRIREAEYRQKKARNGSRIRLLAFLVLALALIAGTFLYISPALRLAAGKQALEAGDFGNSRTTFEALGDFGGARDLIRECDWREAMKKANNSSSAEELAEASALLRAVEGRPEAQEKANELDLLRGRLLLQQGDLDGAKEVLSLLPEDLEGRTALEKECLMTEGRNLMAEKRYAEARAVLAPLDDPEARNLAAKCLYNIGLDQMTQGDLDGAIETLSQIPDYPGSREQILKCHYNKGLLLEAAEDFAGAGNEYLMAGDYEDAMERSRGLIYQEADDLLAQDDVKGARTLYASIPDYLDANAKEQHCRYLLALDAFDDREFTRALELLEGIPDEYEETGSLRGEASYEKAVNAIRQEDWATAAELLGGVDRVSLKKKHRDVENLYLQACREAGIDPYPAPPDSDAGETPAPVPSPAPDEGTPGIPDSFLVTEDDQP